MSVIRLCVETIAQAVNGGASAVAVAQAALDAVADYDLVQPQVWTLRLPAEAVLEQARTVEARIAARDEYTAKRYHQADDEWSADWDYRGQMEDLTVYYDIGRALADSRDWPQWKTGSEFGPARAVSAAERQ